MKTLTDEQVEADADADAQGWTGRPCPRCNGTGIDDPEFDKAPCGACGGTGEENIGPTEPDRMSDAEEIAASVSGYIGPTRLAELRDDIQAAIDRAQPSPAQPSPAQPSPAQPSPAQSESESESEENRR